MFGSKAPLITLFGERLTKQFLSESISALDNLIFALSPLGVLTAVVSVIRICGSSSLRAFVGRAQEGPAEAESELLPCVSESTAELFNDGGITRVFGRPKIVEIVTWENVNYRKETVTKIGTLKDALQDDAWSCNSKVSPSELPELDIPNLSLNTGIKRRAQVWFHCAAILGGVLQTATIAYAAFTVFIYPQHFQKNDKAVASYAFPLYLTGSVLLFIGMFFCAFILERSSKEYYLKAERPSKIYWLQLGNQDVGDQVFNTFLAVKEGPKSSMTTNLSYIKSIRDRRYDGRHLEIHSTLASTILGFVFQFVGLRGLHASVILAQLGSTLLMAIIRTWLRTERMEPDDNKMKDDRDLMAYKQQELDCFAFYLEKVESFDLIPPHMVPLHDQSARMKPAEKLLPDAGAPLGIKLIQTRAQLSRLTSRSTQSINAAWDEMPVRKIAHNLSKMIESTMDLISSWGVEFDDTFSFRIGFECKGINPGSGTQYSGQSAIDLMWRGDDMRWKVDATEMEAVLGLWTWSLCKSNRDLATSKLFRIVGLDKAEASREETYLYFRKWIFRTLDKRLIPSDLIGDQQRLFGHEPKDHSSLKNLLAIYTSNGVEMMTAQDIFIQFLKTAFLQVKELGGQVDISTGAYRRDPNLASNTHINELASRFEAHSLGSREDALLCIVPVLKDRGLLPDLEADSPKTRAHKEEYIKQDNWEEAFDLLLWLSERSEGQHLESSVYELGFLCRQALLGGTYNAHIKGAEQIGNLLRSDIRDWFIRGPFVPSHWKKSQDRIQWWDAFSTQLGWIAWNISTKVPDLGFSQPTLASLNVQQTLSGGNDAGHDVVEVQKSIEAVEYWLTSDILVLGHGGPRANDEIAFDWIVRNNHHALLYFLLLIWIELSESWPSLIMRAYSFASKNRSVSAFRTLLRYRANIEAVDPHGCTALLMRIQNKDLDGVKMLLQYGADPNGKPNGVNESHKIRPLLVALGIGDYDIAELLLQNGASVDVVDQRGLSVLWWACSSGNLAIVGLVLRYNAAIDPVGPDGTTPMRYYAEKGKVEIARFLISKGASTKFDDMSGRPALTPAAKDSSLRNAPLLLEGGPGIVVDKKKGLTGGSGVIRRPPPSYD
ncbi:uncharacterized protein PGRI_049010 [Penicillium griseofulvum]|uniref:Uncharacterized protein n=1 Tax=Penicillium patulum TaxID=5078 RepID=A0A135LAN9_PENPA|nr:uncharacterized protein PGRI_049010 [Penicillium griseofulvum]KXG46045.1 hypothetical protein PGRI_049010 [Penicillium griseofulvum]